MAGALDGIRVVGFGGYIAGPLLAELLAQNGADVVHVDPPGGPRLRGLPDAFLNRGKRRLTLDLGDAEDRSTALRLIRSADVVVENASPGSMSAWGLGGEELVAADPRLIHCSLPGFAADDPRSEMPAWEGVVMAQTAGYRRLAEHWDWKIREHGAVADRGRPVFTGLPVASTVAAALGALRVTAALLRRDRDGRGSRIEVPLAEAMLEIIGFHLDYPGFVDPGAELPKPCLGSFRAADGRHIDQVSYPRFVRALLVAAGEWEAWCAAGLSDIDAVFSDPELRRQAESRFVEVIAGRPAAEWEAMVIDLGASVAMVRTPEEWIATGHARGSRTVVELDDPEFGRVTMAGEAVQLSATPVEIRPRLLPGSSTAEELLSVDASDPRPATSPAEDDRPPLDGITVVELSQVVAGPVAGRLLADLGADVTKIVNPSPVGNNGFHGSFTNRGKRTVYLDVQDADDLARLTRAIDGAQVLLQNYAFGAVERYGIGYETLRATRPDLVYVSLAAYSREGEWRHRRGHENQAVAVTGLSSRYGGEGWPSYQPYLVNDIATGVMGAFATVLGLYHRARTGAGQQVSTSLTQVATLFQAIYLFEGPVEGRLTEPTGFDATGWSALQRVYQTADGWVFLAAADRSAPALGAALGVDRPESALADRDDPAGEAAAVLADALGRRTAGEAATALSGARVVAAPLREFAAVAHDPTWHRRGVLRYAENGEGRRDAPVLGWGETPWAVPSRCRDHPGPLGAQTPEFHDHLQSLSHPNP